MENLLAKYAESDVGALSSEKLKEYAEVMRRKLGRYLHKYRILRDRLAEVEQELHGRGKNEDGR